jgi:hypothetical protein
MLYWLVLSKPKLSTPQLVGSQRGTVMMPTKLYSHEYHYSLHNDCVINYCYLKHTKPGPPISM